MKNTICNMLNISKHASYKTLSLSKVVYIHSFRSIIVEGTGTMHITFYMQLNNNNL